MPDRVVPDCSVGVRHDEQVAGWMITHRAGPDVLQFTCLYANPTLRGTGTGPALLGLAIRRYLEETDLPRCIWMVDAEKKRMQQYVERRLAPVIDSTADEIAVHKPL
jgi:predicted GNAT family acetyltransferase